MISSFSENFIWKLTDALSLSTDSHAPETVSDSSEQEHDFPLVNFSGVVCQGKADDTNLNIL